jgi:glucosyl-3-phosphoglycerate synthase
MQALYALLEDHGLSPGEDGKGRSCWIAFGYALQAGCDVIAVHDCDITTYDRELLARLCYPVVHPDLEFDFAKGYYARVAGKMHGRVTRLLVTPLIRALQSTFGPAPLLDYLGSFRYALSGEFAMKADLARVNRLPGNWGLEVGTLVEVYRRCGTRRVCQTEICNHYDHKHQALSAGNPRQGLLKMCIDVTATLLGALAAEGVVPSGAASRQLLAAYRCTARDTIQQYRADAAINGLRYDIREEQHMVDVFAEAVRAACDQRVTGAVLPLMPTWEEVISAIPAFPSLLQQAVDEDAAIAVAA